MAPASDDTAALTLLASAFDARPVVWCPGCGVPTDLSPNGHVAYCLPCTEAAIGERLPDLLARVGLGKSRKAYTKLLVDRKLAERRRTHMSY